MLPGPDNPIYECCWTVQNEFFRRWKPDTVLDIGANDGGYTATFRSLGARVIAFEPVPSMVEVFKARHGGDPLVTLYQVGLSDRSYTLNNVRVFAAWTLAEAGKVDMSESEIFKGQQSFSLKLTSMDEGHFVPEDTKTLYVKLDVDGYEPAVFRGMKDVITRWRPIMELSGYPTKLGESIPLFARDVLATGYVFVSNGGRKVVSNEDEILRYWPYESSFDVMLIPREKLPLVL
jgi:FkbM family methyltransferase